jgi:hypothetical protein
MRCDELIQIHDRSEATQIIRRIEQHLARLQQQRSTPDEAGES